jgi:hypothetical protein
MIYLNPKSSSIKRAKINHYNGLIDLIFKRIDKIDNIQSEVIFDLCINDYLEKILVGSPSELLQINNRIEKISRNNNELTKDIKAVFNYDWFIDKRVKRYSGYDLANSLNINTCIYCNRNYTNTVITRKGKKIVRPQFDHYFDKSTYPLLALSFFNLIPSCSLCNSSVKNTKRFDLTSHTHPYIDDIYDEFRFTYSYNSDPYYVNGLEIKVEVYRDRFVKNYLLDLAIEEVYNSHSDIVYDLIKTKQSYSERYLAILESSVLDGVRLTKEEIYRLVYGVHMDKTNYSKRPFSKFKKDILTELNII